MFAMKRRPGRARCDRPAWSCFGWRAGSRRALGWVIVSIGIAFTPMGWAQDPTRFETEIRAFEEQVAKSPLTNRSVIFYGSSSFRMWTGLSGDFPQFTVLNRGFGGAQLSDLNYFVDRVIRPVDALAILIYGGDNDIADGKPPEQVLTDFKLLVAQIRKLKGGIPVGFVAVKPSPSRLALLHEQHRANRLVREWASTQAGVSYLEIVTPMLDKKGAPKPELFLEDQLHMNREGYAIWKVALEPWIARALNSKP